MKIGWIGLGNMGLPMAANLHRRGFELVGFDLSSAARDDAAAHGIPSTDSPVDVAADADVLITMLPKGDHVRAALLDSGALAVTAPAALVIDSSTIATAQAVDIAAAVAATGRRFLDAPVSGGTAGARTRR